MELANRGVEVVYGDWDDYDSLLKAFEGAYGVFCVTSTYEHYDTDKELT